MKLFGGKLAVITVTELIDYAAHTQGLIRLELYHCKELDKLVVRVAERPRADRKEQLLGVLVDQNSEELFVAARTISNLRKKLARLLMPIWNRFVIVPLENSFLQLFQGGAITNSGAIVHR